MPNPARHRHQRCRAVDVRAGIHVLTSLTQQIDRYSDKVVSSTRLPDLTRHAIVALAIAFVPQGIWSALIVWNLRTSPTIPWAVIVMAAAILLVAGSLFRRREPSNMSQPTRRPLRANAVPWPLLWRAWLAGTCSVVALVGYWIVLASFVQMPGSVLPDLSAYPWWTRVFAVATGATVSPLCEQLGFWGYWQETLEREFSGLTAVMITAVTFAVLPHPPAHVAFWPKWLFFFLTGLTFSTMAYITDSMLPGLVIHTGALLTFFVWYGPAIRYDRW